jgi:zinc transporter ZupT
MDASTLFWLVVPGRATGIGGLGLLVVRRPGPRLIDTLLGTAAGIMLAASVFSLLVPALDDGSVWEVVAGFAVGAGNEREATAGVVAGFALMMLLDNALG